MLGGIIKVMSNFPHAATELMLRHTETVPSHLTVGMALVAFVGSVEIIPKPEYVDMLDTSWHATAKQAVDDLAQKVDYVATETVDFLKHLKLERSPSEYNQLKLGAFRTVYRYLTTLQSDPAEAWVRKKDIRRLEQARVVASYLKT